MPTATECRGVTSTAVSMTFRGLSVLSFRRNQIASMEPSTDEELHLLALLHSRLASSLQSLVSSPTLSISFLIKLLDAFLSSESDFKSLLLLILCRNPTLISRPPLDRAVSDLLDRYIRALDLCNAVSLSLTSLRQWNRYADIAVSALRPSPPQLGRANRALSKLLLHQSHEKRISRTWSASRQLQAMSAGMAAPRAGDSGSAALLAAAIHGFSSLLFFSMWAITAAFPCGGGAVSPASPCSGPRQLAWAVAMGDLQEKILDERKKERRWEKVGMLAETLAVERTGRDAMGATCGNTETVPLAEELAAASRLLDEGLWPLEKKVREVFHRVMRSREEVQRCVEEGNRSATSAIASPCTENHH